MCECLSEAVGSDAMGAAARTRAYCVRDGDANECCESEGSTTQEAWLRQRQEVLRQRRGGAGAARREERVCGCEAKAATSSPFQLGSGPETNERIAKRSERGTRANDGTGGVPESTVSASMEHKTKSVCE